MTTEKQTPKTLQECKDCISNDNGYKTWEEMFQAESHLTKTIDSLFNQAAELYASQRERAAWDSACVAQKVICGDSCKLNNHQWESILNAPNAEFKPE